MFFKLVSRTPGIPQPPRWTVRFYRDNDVIEFAGGYFRVGTYYGNVRKWGAVIPTERGWDYAEWSQSEQRWVLRSRSFHYYMPYRGEG